MLVNPVFGKTQIEKDGRITKDGTVFFDSEEVYCPFFLAHSRGGYWVRRNQGYIEIVSKQNKVVLAFTQQCRVETFVVDAQRSYRAEVLSGGWLAPRLVSRTGRIYGQREGAEILTARETYKLLSRGEKPPNLSPRKLFYRVLEWRQGQMVTLLVSESNPSYQVVISRWGHIVPSKVEYALILV